MQIRAEQVAVIAQELFLAPCVAYVRRHFAARLRERGVTDLDVFVRAGIERAQSYGVATQLGWARFITVQAVLGADFDERPELAWAVAMLRDESRGTPEQRVDALTFAVTDHLIAEADRARVEGTT